MTREVARAEAARLALEAVQSRHYAGDDPEVVAELNLIVRWLIGRIGAGDKRLTAALEKERGSQVKPGGKQARAIERLAKGGPKC